MDCMNINKFNDLLQNANKAINDRHEKTDRAEFGDRPLSTISTEKAAARGTLVALKTAGLIL